MSMQMNNMNQGGYVPPAFGSGYPSAPSDGPGYAPSYGHQAQGGYPPSTQTGYAPISQGGYAPPPQGVYSPPQQGSYVPPGYPPISQQPYGGGGPAYDQYGGQQMSYGGAPQQQYGSPYGGGGPQGQPIMTQPPGGDWMNIPIGIPNCPPGLEYLTTVDQLLVKQKVELLEAFTGFETNNKFTIKNSLGQKVYYAVEDNDCCTRNCCGPMRPFDMKVLDNYKNEVIHMYRKLACSSCLFPCCLQEMEISSPPGTVVGTVEQEWSICNPQFKIKNHLGDVVLRIEGPFCTFSLCGDVEFKVVSLTGEEVGKISKQWSGLAREFFTDADFFGITFPMDLDVRMKAVLLGACFLIDAMFFEKSGNQETDRPGML